MDNLKYIGPVPMQPFKCTFCGGRNSPFLRRIRTRSSDSVIGEIRHLYNTYGSPYYNELYNADTRIMTIKVNLNAGDINTFMGTDAGKGSASIAMTGAQNTCIGAYAGYSFAGAPNYNTLVGASAG